MGCEGSALPRDAFSEGKRAETQKLISEKFGNV